MPTTQKSTPELGPKVIKTDRDYRAYLAEIERLAVSDPAPNSREWERLELLVLLVEAYEKETFPFEKPDPIEAIEFRMNEQGLRQADLVPYFGSRSRVSEVLARKRPLTVQMIRDISQGLGIPAGVLLSASIPKDTAGTSPVTENLEWEKFPAKEMQKHGYFEAIRGRSLRSLADYVRDFYLNAVMGAGTPALLARRTIRGDAFSPKSQYALLAWRARVIAESKKRREGPVRKKYESGMLDLVFMRQIAQLSWHEDGPRLAREFVEGVGIPVVIERHLSGTYLDGAALLDADGAPVIGLTLRFDRLDSFWFTLMHELAHVMRHLNAPGDVFLDRLEDHEAVDRVELEANKIARDVFVPRPVWKRSGVVEAPSVERILALAKEQKIHPAVVAGRVRRETNNFRLFRDLLGVDQVRKQFPDVTFG